MQLRHIGIENYKGFEKCNIDFHDKLNVIIGSNASGKTSILTAIVKTIYNITGKFATPNRLVETLKLTSGDINYAANYCNIFSVFNDFSGFENPIMSSVITNLGGNNKITSGNVKVFVKWFENNCRQSTFTIPIIKFYPANRGAVGYIENNKHKDYLISQLETWSNIYQDSLSYSRFFTWFLEHETQELLLQRDSGKFDIKSPALQGIRKALEIAFKMMDYPNFEIKTKQRQRQSNTKLIPTLVLENKNGVIEYIDNKSDGEKAIITLIADIAYNLSVAKSFLNDDDFLGSKGIVLIDEIETHLHPKWQREIIPMLTTIFPNIQFFITTHSPQVISSVNSESVLVCDKFEVQRMQLKTNGEDTNSLLKYIFNTTERPKQYLELLNKFDKMMGQRKQYDELIKIIGEVELLVKKDNAPAISNLTSEMAIQLAAYKFEMEHEINK